MRQIREGKHLNWMVRYYRLLNGFKAFSCEIRDYDYGYDFCKIGIMIRYYDKIMAFGSTALRTATLVFLFIAPIRVQNSYSLIGVSRKSYGPDLVAEVRTLEKLDFKHERQFSIQIFLYLVDKN